MLIRSMWCEITIDNEGSDTIDERKKISRQEQCNNSNNKQKRVETLFSAEEKSATYLQEK